MAQLAKILMEQVKEQKPKKTKKSLEEEKLHKGSYHRVSPWEYLGTRESSVLEKWIDMESHLEWCRMWPQDWVVVASGFLEDYIGEWHL